MVPLKKQRIFTLLCCILFLYDIFLAHTIWTNLRTVTNAEATTSIQAKAFATTCNNNPQWQRCYMDKFDAFTRSTDINLVLDVLWATQQEDHRTYDCHLLGHAIAFAEISKDPSKWQDFLTHIRANECTGGFIHGTMESLSFYDKKFQLNSATAESICDSVVSKVKDGKEGLQYCAHIVGHLLLVETGGSPQDATKVCDGVRDEIQYQCFGGIFMENITRDNLFSHGISKKRPTNSETTALQEQLCYQQTGVAAMGCWREISHMYVVMAKDDPATTYDLCAKANNTKNWNECYLHAVTLLVREKPTSDDYFTRICHVYGKDTAMTQSCIRTGVSALLASSKQYQPLAEQFCEAQSDTNKPFCNKTISAFFTKYNNVTIDEKE